MNIEQKFIINGTEVALRDVPDEHIGVFYKQIRDELQRRRKEYVLRTIREQLNEEGAVITQ